MKIHQKAFRFVIKNTVTACIIFMEKGLDNLLHTHFAPVAWSHYTPEIQQSSKIVTSTDHLST